MARVRRHFARAVVRQVRVGHQTAVRLHRGDDVRRDVAGIKRAVRIAVGVQLHQQVAHARQRVIRISGHLTVGHARQ